ncbi:hypothetical protein FRX31_020153 [Thalictrum thalictroides]|uniref:FBD domain-containing protein n=1 Tax=Thalictrum thalictroides TaxID=46969 RepID=A0A7J6W180_THATH|nr:hypothetical protein FRX31_020153 [Thalictrum thalictroides]
MSNFSFVNLIGILGCAKVLSNMEMEMLPTPSTDWQDLRLKTDLTKSNLPGITRLLRTSPNLYKLTIRLNSIVQSGVHVDDELNYWNSVQSLPCLEKTLEYVNIYNFNGETSEIALVEFLLKKARKLEQMIIYSKKNDMLAIHQKVLSFERASPESAVMLYLGVGIV